MATLTVSPTDEKRVKALGFLSNKGTDNFSGRIITVNGKITAAQQLRDELADACSDESLDFLLGFEDPLGFVVDYWKAELMRDSHSDEIGRMLWEVERQGEVLAPTPPRPPAKHTPPRLGRGQER